MSKPTPVVPANGSVNKEALERYERLRREEGYDYPIYVNSKGRVSFINSKPTRAVAAVARNNSSLGLPKAVPERARERVDAVAVRTLRPRVPYARNAANAARALQNAPKENYRVVSTGRAGEARVVSRKNKFGRIWSPNGKRQIGGPESILPPEGTYGASNGPGKYSSRKNRKNRKTRNNRRRKNRTRRNRR